MTLLSPSSSSRRHSALPVVLSVVLALAVGVASGWYFASRDDAKAAATPTPTPSSSCSTSHSSTAKPVTSKPATSKPATGKPSTSKPATGKPTTKPSSTLVAFPPPAAIIVNVYNATTRKGLAKSTSLELAARGFHTNKVTNDPSKKLIAASAEVRYGPAGVNAARVVAAQVVGAVLVPDNRKDGSVDFVLGEGFAALASTAQANASISALASPTATPGC